MKKHSQSNLFKNKWFQDVLLIFILTVLLLAGIYWIVYYEQENDQVLQYTVDVGEKVYNYKIANGTLPSSLGEIGINEKYCVWFIKCFVIKYHVSDDRKDYKLVSKVNGWIIFFAPHWEPSVYCVDKYRGGCADFGMAFLEDYKGERTDWPIYKRDKLHFATPSAWPDL